MNLELEQQSCIQLKLRTNEMIQYVKSAFSPDQSVLPKFCSTATRSSAAGATPAYATILPRLVDESSLGHHRKYTKRLTISVPTLLLLAAISASIASVEAAAAAAGRR